MDREHMRKIASKGAKARIKLYGNPGTTEGRKLGGLRSQKTHQLYNTGFQTLRKISKPRKSAKLAELLGIFMGDGHVHTYQASICTNSETDIEHTFFARDLIKELFAVPVNISYSKTKKACTVVVSSKEVCRFLVKHGIPAGNKLSNKITIQSWILDDVMRRRAFIRGLIDTDGCIYEDSHNIKNKKYSYTCIAFTSASSELRDFVFNSLVSEGWNPTKSGKHVRLRRMKEVREYLKVIGTSNPKHLRRSTL